MSVVKRSDEQKRQGFAGLSLASIYSGYIGDDPMRARNVAMLSLLEICGWGLPQIMTLTGLSKGGASIAISKTRRELREFLAENGEGLSPDDSPSDLLAIAADENADVAAEHDDVI